MYWKDKIVVVTGAGGFIGSHLVEKLLEEGARVKAIVRYNSQNNFGYLENLETFNNQKLEIFTLNMIFNNGLKAILKNCDCVFNLAAHIDIPYSYSNPEEVINNNIAATLNILLASRENDVRRIIQTSTSEVYGSAKQIPIAETHVLQPQSPYSASKIATDNIALSFYYSFNLPITIVRPFNTFGPRQSARAVIPTIISQSLKGESIKLGNIATTRDFTYVDDTVRGFMMLAESDDTLGEVFNLGTGIEISIKELVNKINAITGNKNDIIIDKDRLRPNKSEVLRLCSDYAKVNKCVEWIPQYSIEEGLKRTIAWITQNLDKYKTYSYNI